MSTKMCSDAHIKAVAIKLTMDPNFKPIKEPAIWGEFKKDLHYAIAIANDLRRWNVEAMHYAYISSNTRHKKLKITKNDLKRLTGLCPLQLIKLMHSLDYQIAGTPGWNDSPLRKALDDATRLLIYEIEEYSLLHWILPDDYVNNP